MGPDKFTEFISLSLCGYLCSMGASTPGITVFAEGDVSSDCLLVSRRGHNCARK